MLKVAITGNIASGKSQVEKIISEYGFLVFDSDKIAHSCLDNLTDFYGYDVFTNGKIDRKKLGNLVFNDSDLKKKLEYIIHPMVKDEILKIFEKNKNEKAVFISVPLLFEANFIYLFDKVILVTTDEKIRLNRLINRNNFTPKEAENRIKSQIPEWEKVSVSDYVIENNSTFEELKKNTKIILSLINNQI